METNNFPDKFKNEDGTLNSESLLKSYAELEKKLGGMVNIPSDDSDEESREKFYSAIGVPKAASEYPDDPMFSDMPELKEKFKEIKLSKKQAEEVCKLASEYLTPALNSVMSKQYESGALTDLKTFFGGDEKMGAALSEINNYAEKNLSPEAYETLCSSADGIKTIYKMMQSNEPKIMASNRSEDSLNKDSLRQMMRDPKYWRDHDDEFIRKIESGFKKLYA